MNEKINEVMEKRTALWEKMKSFLDTAKRDGDTLAPEAVEQYEKMERDMAAFDKEIDMLNRQKQISERLIAPTSKPITGNPYKSDDEEQTGVASKAYNSAFWNAMRYKSVPYDVTNALQIGTDTEGGYLVPDEFEHTLVQALEEENIFRKIAHTIKTSTGDRKIPVVASHGTASWVEEEGLIEDSDEKFDQVSLGAYKLATSIKVSEELLSDSVFSIDAYLASEFARRIGSKEEDSFINGDGTNKPTGIFNDTHGGKVGVTAKSAEAISFDEIYDLYYSLKKPYRRGAVWIMNDSTIKAIRKLKDQDGRYLWQPATGAETPDTLLNRPIYTSAYAPIIESGKCPIAFGDFGYYWIADRQGRTFKRLNEIYAKNGQVGFLASQRVDGKLILPEAVQILKMGASEAA